MNKVEFYSRYNEVSSKVLELSFNYSSKRIEDVITTSREMNTFFLEVVKDDLQGNKIDLLA